MHLKKIKQDITLFLINVRSAARSQEKIDRD
jgi:hypothetical protein